MNRIEVANLAAQLGYEVEHLGLHRGVEPGGRLVQDQQRRIAGQGRRDADPLLHPARELVRIAVHDRTGSAIRTRLSMATARSCGLAARHAGELEVFGQLAADLERRVQRLAGVLIDHRDAGRAHAAQLGRVHRQYVAPRHLDPAAGDSAVGGQVAHDGQRYRRLAAARFADQPIGLAPRDGEVDLTQHGADRGGARGRRRPGREPEGRAPHSRNTPATPSAIRLTPTTSDAIASASNSTVHQKPPPIRP